jgi:formate hydrogenlyase subunit 3/multisubunit Na+/H+ antiporter MnhD subunit
LPGWLFGVGYIAAIGLPIVGFVIGVVMLTKGETNHGVAMMVLSVVVTAIVLGGGLL